MQDENKHDVIEVIEQASSQPIQTKYTRFVYFRDKIEFFPLESI